MHPSLVDNSPYVIIEALELGLNFVATNSGGQAEMIYGPDRARVLCLPSAERLSQFLRLRWSQAPFKARPSLAATKANESWLKFHSNRQLRIEKQVSCHKSSPLVSIILLKGHNSGAASDFAGLASILLQTYEKIELCVSEDDEFHFSTGLPKNMTLKFYKKTRTARSQHKMALKSAKGKYVFFLGEGRLADRETLRYWVKSAEAAILKDPLTIATSGILNIGENLKQRHKNFYSIPSPVDRSLILAGDLPVNSHALWSRKLLTKNIGGGVNFFSKKSQNAFCSFLLTKGYQFAAHPQIVVKQSSLEFFSNETPTE